MYPVGAGPPQRVSARRPRTLENNAINLGHGNQHPSTVLMHLMMLAFLIDQIQPRGTVANNRRIW